MKRFYRAFAPVVFFACLSSHSALALDAKIAQTLVESTATETLRIVQTGGQSLANQTPQIKTLLLKSADMRAIAGFSLGRYASQMPENLKVEYVDLFTSYITRWFVDQFKGYQGEVIKVLGAQDLGAQGANVQIEVIRGAEKISTQWIVSDKSGSPKIIDLVVEGTSLAQAHRSEFTGLLDGNGGNINAFLDILRQRSTL